MCSHGELSSVPSRIYFVELYCRKLVGMMIVAAGRTCYWWQSCVQAFGQFKRVGIGLFRDGEDDRRVGAQRTVADFWRGGNLRSEYGVLSTGLLV